MSLEEDRKPVLYTRRWFFLLAIACINCLQTFTTLIISQVNNIFVAYFHITYASADWGTLGKFLGMMLFTLLTAFLVHADKIRIRKMTNMCALMLTIGLFLKLISLASRNSYWLLIIGLFFVGACNATVIALVPAFTVQWFPDNEIGTAYAINLFGASIGIIMGVLIPSEVMMQPPKSGFNSTKLPEADWLLYDRNAALVLYGIPLMVAAFILLMFFAFLTDRPPTPPTLVQSKQSSEQEIKSATVVDFMDYIAQTKAVLTNKSFVVVVLGGSFVFHAMIAELLMMSQLYRELFHTIGSDLNPDKFGGYTMALMSAGGLTGVPVSAALVNRVKRYKLQFVAGSALTFIFSIGIILGLHFEMIWVIMTSNFFYGASIRIAIIPVLEIITQSTYPIKEGYVGSIYACIQSLISILIAEMARIMMDRFGSLGMLLVHTGSLTISLLLSLFVDSKYKRLEAEADLEEHCQNVWETTGLMKRT